MKTTKRIFLLVLRVVLILVAGLLVGYVIFTFGAVT